MKMLYEILFVSAISLLVQAAERPRGVSPSKASFYQPGKEFTCLTSGEVVSWEFVNDDYCDCKDGSDEPGTAACSNGFFYCENRGHRGAYVISSRVNDGICDCCDGADEFAENIKCSNVCDELGHREREERETFRQLQEQGYKLRQEYIQQGKRTKDEKRSRLSELEKQMAEFTAARDEQQKKKEEVEVPEKAAKEVHEKYWEAYKAGREKEKDRVRSVHAFAEMDVNADLSLDYVEVQKHPEFDIDSDGTVSVEEAREYLDDNDFVSLETFQEKVWPNIKDLYKPSEGSIYHEIADRLPDDPATPTPQDPTPPVKKIPVDESEFDEGIDAGEEEEEDDDDDDDDRNYKEEVDEEEQGDAGDKPKEEEEKMLPYPEVTQKLIEAADAARNVYNEANTKVQDTENEIDGLKKYLEVDYGPDEEFSVLRGQCFEYTDREYTYKLCPFDKTVQKPKSGGIETSLGKWGHWYGPEEDKFDAMKYENGQSCWNGPNRSCHVNLHCGTENKLTGASEPSRCEYQFEFTTPTRCKQPEPLAPEHEHTEL